MSFENKYKNRMPEETCDIIKNFFKERNFEIKIHHKRSEIGTDSCIVDLFYEDYLIMTSNGKGMNETFSEASGLAELYERFCNKNIYYTNHMFVEKFIKTNKLNHGYQLDENEIEISLLEMINDNKPFKDLFERFDSKTIEMLLKKSISKKGIGVPYHNVVNDLKVKYFDPRLLIRLNHSTGMAAGNTFKEAFNQGYSEILERAAFIEFLLNKYDKHYVIKHDSIKNERLQEIIKRIEENNKKIFFIDLSYNSKLPVIVSVILDCGTLSVNFNAGAFPDPFIAIERCLTETWQNLESLESYNKTVLIPERVVNLNYVVENALADSKTDNVLADDFFEKMIVVERFGDAFLRTELTNDEIYEYYKHIDEKMGFETYYKDNSLCENMVAIHLVPTNLKVSALTFHDNNPEEYDFEYIEDQLELLNEYKDELIKVKHPNVEVMVTNFKSMFLKPREDALIRSLVYRDWTTPIDDVGIWYCGEELLKFIVTPVIFKDIYSDFDHPNKLLRKNVRKFQFINSFKLAGYDYDKILKMNHFGIDISMKDYLYSADKNYLTEQLLVKPIVEFYNSDTYNHLIQSWMK